MPDLCFDFEWIDPGGARGPELRATWARFTVRVAGKPVTRVCDARTRSVRESLYLPLYPLAEWLASNWWRLLYEVRSPWLSSRNGFESRHSLAEAGEGFALPRLVFEPMGDVLRLSWTGKRLAQAPLEFLGQGSAFLSRQAVLDHLRAFVDAVLGRLDEEGIQQTPLHEEWRSVQQMEPDEEAFCRLTAALGLDPFAITREQERAVLTASEEIPESLREEFFSSADPAALIEEAATLRKTIEALAGAQGLEPLLDLRTTLESLRSSDLSSGPESQDPPWSEGYSAAQALRAHLDLDGRPLPSFRSIGEALGVEGDVLEEGVLPAHDLVTVDGVVAPDSEGQPGFAVRAVTHEARRFNFCRELLEFLSSPDTAAPSIVTRSATHRQQRNRAFAAEFLLPSEALQARVAAEEISYPQVNEIAEEFGVSWAVVSHQLDNHRIARVIPD